MSKQNKINAIKESRCSRRRYKLKKLNKNHYLRLSVFRSHKHIYAQIIDDQQSKTIVSASTLDAQYRDDKANAKLTGMDQASKIGSILGKKALDKGVSKIVFDSGSHMFHGRVKALAAAAREQGLIF